MDNVIENLKSHQVELVHEMREQPWRQRVIRFYDPDLHIIEIGESLAFLSGHIKNYGEQWFLAFS